MEKISNSLFEEPTLNSGVDPVAGNLGNDLCLTAVGGTVTYCATRDGSGSQDIFTDTGE